MAERATDLRRIPGRHGWHPWHVQELCGVQCVHEVSDVRETFWNISAHEGDDFGGVRGKQDGCARQGSACLSAGLALSITSGLGRRSGAGGEDAERQVLCNRGIKFMRCLLGLFSQHHHKDLRRENGAAFGGLA